jgi:hypothetical protein
VHVASTTLGSSRIKIDAKLEMKPKGVEMEEQSEAQDNQPPLRAG